jgi:4-diphosphocytidyl-2-C-methyl-D-erythritol kinase
VTVEFAPAKLTTRLKLVGLRADGYHLIDAEMVTLQVGDVVSFDDGDSLTMSGPFAAGIDLGPTNLVNRALRAVGRRAAVHVEKRIPAGGGLGGGSADAAAVLRWAGVNDLSVAASLGADVPFCVVGGRARVTGIGEIIEPLEPIPEQFTLCIPPLAVSTPAAYRAWDELGGPICDGPNDLEAGALLVEPRLAHWRDRLREACGVEPILAGSGATWFCPGAHDEAAAALPDATVIVTQTCV